MYVNPATLQPLCAQPRDIVGVRALRQPLRKKQITVRNLHQVTTLVLLGMRAKTVRATYKRHWKYIANLKPRKFLWDSPEGDEDAASRQKALLTYIEAHLPLIDSMATRIRLSEMATKRWVTDIGRGWS